jgi:glycosyltransferase involved in cell wall biosynthesis
VIAARAVEHEPAALPAGARLSIAVLSYGLPTPGQKRGGIERVAHELAEGLAIRGHHVTVFTHDPRPRGATYEVAPLPWRGFVNTWLGRRITMGYLGNVLMLLTPTEGFDVTIAHGDSLLLRLTGRPFVRVMHGTAWEEARSATSVGRFVLQAGVFAQELLSAATGRCTVGVSENTRARNRFISRVIPNGVNRDVFSPDERERSPRPTLAFVGALAGRKRGRWLLDLFSSVIRLAHPQAELLMVSAAGPELPGVTYYEGVTDAELASVYRRAWVYASPSTYEGFGLPYLESMACGTPVVATPNPGSREVLARGGGVLASDDEFGPAVLALLGDAARRRTLATEGLAVAAERDLTAMVDAYEALLLELTHRHGKRTDA